MKRLFLVLLLLTYAGSTWGMTLHQHTCMGKPLGVSLVSHKDKDCPRCGMPESAKTGCCGETSTTFKVKDDHSASSLSFDLVPPVVELSSPVLVLVLGHLNNMSKHSPWDSPAPPGSHLRRLAILRVFRL